MADSDEQSCPKCQGLGWLWWNELNYYEGPADETGMDDTKYPCDHCGESGDEEKGVLMIWYHKRNDGLYVCDKRFVYYSARYGQWVQIEEGQVRDGASGAFDIRSSSWWVHDQLCADGCWLNGAPVTAWQCATVLRDILKQEGRWARAFYWRWATFLLGCKRPRENGWFHV